jgi:ABC-type transport system involved in multi-copper enzyme maturation permease subunit
MTTTLTPRPAPTGSDRPPTFGDVVRAEWTKERSVRSTMWTVLTASVVAIGLGVLFSAITANQYAKQASIRANWDPTAVSTGGLGLAQLAIVVLGVLFITSEYSSKAIVTTLTAVPRRNRLLAAKTLVIAALSFVIAEVLAFVTFFIGQALISGHAPTASLSQPGVLRALIGAGLYGALIGVLGLALGAILRNAAAAIAIMVAVLYVLPGVSAALPGSIEHTVEKFWPTNAGQQVTNVMRGSHTLSPWEGFAVLAIFVAIVLAGGFALINRRDA